jgi:hypothetical protein
VVFLWFSLSATSLLVHFGTWARAFAEVGSGKYDKMYKQIFKEMGIPDGKSSMDILRQTIGVIVYSLHLGLHWVRALDYDVLLSVVSLCVWTAVTQTDARAMVKSSLFPWLDEAQNAVEQAASRIGEATEELYEDIQDSQPLARARDAWSSAKEQAKRRTASARYGFTDAESDDEEYERPTRAGRARSNTRRASMGAAGTRSRSRTAVSPAKRNASSRRSSRARSSSMSRNVYGLVGDGKKFASSVEAVAVRTEAAALTMGLFAVGGLGVASAAVYGAEG